MMAGRRGISRDASSFQVFAFRAARTASLRADGLFRAAQDGRFSFDLAFQAARAEQLGRRFAFQTGRGVGGGELCRLLSATALVSAVESAKRRWSMLGD